MDERVIQWIGRSFILTQAIASILFAKLVRCAITDELEARLRLRFQEDSAKDRVREASRPDFGISGFSYLSRNFYVIWKLRETVQEKQTKL